MDPKKLKRLLAGVSIVGLLSAGCSTTDHTGWGGASGTGWGGSKGSAVGTAKPGEKVPVPEPKPNVEEKTKWWAGWPPPARLLMSPGDHLFSVPRRVMA